MVKLFFLGIGIFVLAVVGVFGAVLTPLMFGVSSNLGGVPQSPFHSPIPGPIDNAVHDAVRQATPPVLLEGVLALAALLLIYTLGNLIRHFMLEYQATRRRWAELRWRAHAGAGRPLEASTPMPTTTSPTSSPAATQVEIDALWK